MASLAWEKADSLVKAAFARYNDTVSGEKFGDLYAQDSEGNFMLLEYPVRWGICVYYVSEDFPAVYKFNERTGKYRESKTAYKAIKAAERAIDNAISLREFVEAVDEQYTPNRFSFDTIQHAWRQYQWRQKHKFWNGYLV